MTQSLNNGATETLRQPAVLVITVGTTDIKFGVHVDKSPDSLLSGKAFPVDPPRPERCVHEWLLTKELANEIAFASIEQFDAYEKSLRENQSTGKPDGVKSKRIKLAFAPDKSPNLQLHPSEQEKQESNVSSGLFLPEKPELWLVKVMPVVKALLESNKYRVEMAVVLSTHRHNSHRHNFHCHSNNLNENIARKEPVAAGKIICHWLAEQLNLKNIGHFTALLEQPENASNTLLQQFKESQNGLALYINFLDGEMALKSQGENTPVNRKGMQRIDDLLFGIARLSPKTNTAKWHCVYSPGGGFPDFKAQISSACHLYFETVELVVEPEFSKEKLTFADADKYPAPDVSYRSRKQAIQLLQRGDYAGAATIARLVQHQTGIEVSGESNKTAQEHYNWRWTQVLLDVSHWLQGTLSEEQADKIQKDNKHPLHQLVGSKTPYALVVALRIEAALQQNHIQEAIRYTSDLAEVLIYDYLSLVFSEKDEKGRADYRYFEKSGEIQASQANLIINAIENGCVEETFVFPVGFYIATKADPANILRGKKQQPILEYDAKGNWNITTFSRPNAREWQSIASYVQSGDNEGALQQYKLKMRGKGEPAPSFPVYYRNKITHQVLTAEQIKAAVKTYQAAGLWNPCENQSEQRNVCTAPGYQAHFLSQEVVINVFKPMFRVTPGDGDLLKRYQTLINQTVHLIFQADIAWRE